MGLPTKIKVFLLRACKDWLPTMVSLARLKIPVNCLCPMCSKSFKTTTHAMWECLGLKKVRSSIYSFGGLRCRGNVPFIDFFSSCLHLLGYDELELLSLVLWQNWYLRNQWIHGGEQETLSLWVFGMWSFLGIYKLNTDASLDACSHHIGLGFVIRDCVGAIMATNAQRVEVNLTPKLAEALAILRGFTFAIDSGLLPIINESDALDVFNLIKYGKAISSDVGLYVLEIRELLLRHVGCVIVFVSRKANAVAHNIDKIGLSIVEDCFWMESYPPSVEQFVHVDCSM
ncbi:hypothetical protein Q3G72_003368 [Acer saccharum]|nr:hypothetical protein Q3G72_003368 [Acer saccharum]